MVDPLVSGLAQASGTTREMRWPRRFTSAAPDGAILAGAGRALNVCATGEDRAEARERAHGALALIDWPEGFHRTDIGWRAMGR